MLIWLRVAVAALMCMVRSIRYMCIVETYRRYQHLTTALEVLNPLHESIFLHHSIHEELLILGNSTVWTMSGPSQRFVSVKSMN